jgi:hypothetical protein
VVILPAGKRRQRRPRKRQLVDVENDLRYKEVRRWRLRTSIREEGAAVITEAKVLAQTIMPWSEHNHPAAFNCVHRSLC